jgi:hypothetical protein
MMNTCKICSRTLNNPEDPLSVDCGGDCAACMAVAGDPECEQYVAGFRACVEMIRDKANKYGIGSMSSQWTAEDIASDILARVRL